MARRVLWLVCGAVACGVAASVAFGSPQFASTLTFTYSSQVPGSPSGIDSLATFSDPGEPGGKPKELVKLKLRLHPGSRLDTTALPRCRASDRQVRILGLRACPASTRLGTVQGEGVISTGLRFNPVGHLFNARRAIIVVATVDGRYITSFRDDVTRRTVMVNFRIPRGISFTRFMPHIPRHFNKRGKRRKAYMRTPRSCPASGRWTTHVVFFYRDGSTEERAAATPCSR